MTKTDTIKEIRRLNPTANLTFLEAFSDRDLQEYLQRLWEAKDGFACDGGMGAGRG